MKKIFILFLTVAITACGTNLKMTTSGPIKPPEGEAAVLIQYRFEAVSDEHELFLLDEDMHRYNIKIPKEIDTKSGFIIYLPIQKKYALSSLLTLKSGRTFEYRFGKDLTLFSLDRKFINRVPYFEIYLLMRDRPEFVLRGEDPHFVEIHKNVARSKFQTDLPMRSLKIEELN